MKDYKGAVFFDVDGTLVDERLKIYQPTEMTKRAIARLKENGYLVGIATGRSRCYIPKTDIDFDCYVTSNGAVAEVDGKEIHNDFISEEDLKTLIDYMESEGIGYAIEGSKACYVQAAAEEKFRKFLEIFHIPFSDCFSVLDDPKGKRINKVIITFSKMQQYEAMKEKFAGRFSVIQHHNNLSADVGKTYMNKAVGVRAVIAALQLDMKDTYAFGDDGNDVEMLAAVGCGIAMTPHAKGLDKAADYITGGVGEEGIYHALAHFKLI